MRLIVLFSIWILLFSCNPGKINKELYYDDHQIAMVIADLYLTGQILEDVPEEIRDSLRLVYREQLTAIHKIDMDSMEQDIEKVQGDPSRYLVIHKLVRDSISAFEAKYKLLK